MTTPRRRDRLPRRDKRVRKFSPADLRAHVLCVRSARWASHVDFPSTALPESAICSAVRSPDCPRKSDETDLAGALQRRLEAPAKTCQDRQRRSVLAAAAHGAPPIRRSALRRTCPPLRSPPGSRPSCRDALPDRAEVPAQISATDPPFGNANRSPRFRAGGSRRHSAQSGGWIRIIHRCPSGSATWAAKAFHSCCEGS